MFPQIAERGIRDYADRHSQNYYGGRSSSLSATRSVRLKESGAASGLGMVPTSG